MLPVRNGRVCQVASHIAVSLSKAAYRVPSVADADVQAGTQPKIVAHVVQGSALIALLKGVERHDGRVRQRLCGEWYAHTVHETYASGRPVRTWQRDPSGRVEGRLCEARGFDRGGAAPLCLWLRTQHARKSQAANVAGDVR